jgi:hypothetical protein
MERDSSMVQLILIGISAGAAAALLFASVASGSAISLLLTQLAPLPILIAALGWSHWAALIAALTASLALAAIFGGFFFIASLLSVGIPAWWLGYLALLARPAERPTEDGLDWYPVGRLVVWTAIISSVVIVIAIVNVSIDGDTFQETLRKAIARMLTEMNRTAANIGNIDRATDLLVAAIPGGAGVLNTLTLLVNLWLAARVVSISGRLRRPVPDIAAMEFPGFAPIVTGAAVAGSFLPGMIGIAAGVLAASMLTVYALLGFAVLHSLTRGTNGRPFVLGGVYAALVFVWPVLIMTLLGLAEAAFNLRARAARRRGPPNTRT